MKAALLTGIRKIEVREIPKPSIKDDLDVLLRVTAVGICGSDVQYYATGKIGSDVVQFPFAIGHECVAEVEKVGSRVKRVKPGDKVVVDPALSCGKCDQCLKGRPNTCRQLRFLGCPGQREGCLAEFILMPEANCYPLGDDIKTEWSILVEPLSIGIYSLRLLGDVDAETVAVLGSGPIGLSVMMAAGDKGIQKIYATDKIEARLKASRKAGAVWAGNPDVSDIVEDITKLEPLGLDAVFECCGDQQALDQAVELLKPGGSLMIVGIPETEIVSFDAHRLRRKEVKIQNIRRQNDCFEAAIDYIGKKGASLDFMVTHKFSLQDTQEAFELVEGYRDGVVKAIIRP